MDEALAKGINLYIRTTGRHTGAPRPVHLWFAYEDGHVFLLSLVHEDGGHTHWYRNLRKDPECLLDLADRRYRAVAVSMDPDPELEARIRSMFREKYGERPYRRWFGDEPMTPVTVRVIEEVTRR
jgi:hypothetical protein